MFSDRRYDILPSTTNRYAKLVKTAERASMLMLMDEDYDRAIDWFFKSETYANLPEEQRRLSRNSVEAIAKGNPWGLDVRHRRAGLFPGKEAMRQEPSQPIDAFVLSGAAGWDLLNDEEIDSVDFDLDRLRLLGAMAVNNAGIDESWTSVELGTAGLSTPTILRIGADLNGDFRAAFSKHVPARSLTPNGESVPLAPSKLEGLAAYHSVELDMVSVMLEHWAGRLDESDKRMAYQEITQGEKWGRGGDKGQVPFGEYGSAASLSFIREWYPKEDDFMRKGLTIEEFPVHPGSQSSRVFKVLRMISEEDGVRMVMGFKQQDHSWIEAGEGLFVHDSDIATVVRAIATANRGRVAPFEFDRLIRHLLLGEPMR